MFPADARLGTDSPLAFYVMEREAHAEVCKPESLRLLQDLLADPPADPGAAAVPVRAGGPALCFRLLACGNPPVFNLTLRPIFLSFHAAPRDLSSPCEQRNNRPHPTCRSRSPLSVNQRCK